MALLRYGPLASQVLGSIQGTTFTETGQGAAVKARTSRPILRSPAKLAAESAAAEVAKAWRSLTNPQRAGWTALGLTLVRSTAIGGKYRPTGYATFLALNMALYNAGAAINSTAPTITPPPSLTTAQLLPTYSGAAPIALTAAWNAATPISTALALQMTPAFGFGANPDPKRLQRVATFSASATPVQDVTTAWTAVFGNLPQTTGYRILARLFALDEATGATGCPLDFVLADQSATPIGAAPTTTTPTTTTPATENQLYTTPGDTANPAYLYLALLTTSTYTISFSATNTSGAPQLLAGPNVGSLTPIHNFATQDTVTLTPAAATLYFVTTTAWPAAQAWTVLLQTVLNRLPPSITAISPSTGPAAGGTVVTLTGTNFRARDLVYFGATPALISDTSDPETATVTSPPGTAGTVDITVHADNGCSAPTTADHFTYT